MVVMEEIQIKSQPAVRSRPSAEHYADASDSKRATIADRDEAELAFFGRKQRVKVGVHGCSLNIALI